jgi:hypothetical protein
MLCVAMFTMVCLRRRRQRLANVESQTATAASKPIAATSVPPLLRASCSLIRSSPKPEPATPKTEPAVPPKDSAATDRASKRATLPPAYTAIYPPTPSNASRVATDAKPTQADEQFEVIVSPVYETVREPAPRV